MASFRVTATIVAFAVGLAGCSPANVYDMPADEAYSRLFAVKEGAPSKIKGSNSRRSVKGDPGKSVTWITDGAHAYYECTAYLTPEGATKTSVNVGCSDANAGGLLKMSKAVSQSVYGDMATGGLGGVRNRYIELVDSTLDGRPFDEQRGDSKVMGWPDPPTTP